MTQKNVQYESSKPYVTLNKLGSKTENIWMVFHGMGYLSRYFLRPFSVLDADKNYFIAPQAPSKYYLDDTFKYVGASWLTREDLEQELENVLLYVDAVSRAEQINQEKNLILFGFSQGVSILARWVASRKIQCEKLILYAGGIPQELRPDDFAHINHGNTKVKIIYGDNDKYISEDRILLEKKKVDKLFANNAEIMRYEGIHEVNPEVLKTLL